MELFKTPYMEIVKLDGEDIVTNSGCDLDFDCPKDDPEHCGYVCAGVCDYNACRTHGY